VLVACALPAERRALRGLARRGLEVHVTGMGAAAAGRAGAALVARAPRALLAAGFCGALDPGLRVGDLVAAERVVDEASGEAFVADAGLLAAAPGRRGTLVSAVRLARGPAERARLAGTAVDLESAALARAAAAAGVPFLALRAVSDTARQTLPDFSRMADGEGRLRVRAGARHLIGHPGELPALIRLAPAARRAGRSLAAGVEAVLAAVA
jgi:adenosylhomocysteine nucleosidase